MDERLIDCPDGRVLEVATLGDPANPTVFFHHGSPGSSRLITSLAPLSDAGFFLVTTSRAGYGRSSRLAGRRVVDVVDDVRVTLDALGRDTYAAVGWSGGGPHALACGASDAGRCLGAWSLAGVAPIDADFDWTEGMGPENLEEFALALEGGPAYEAHMQEAAEQFGAAREDTIVGLFGGLLSEPDKAALADLVARESLASATRHAFVEGHWGFYDDDRAFFAPWGFEPSESRVPTYIWYGDHDLMVPPTHGAWLAERIEGSHAVHRPSDGHVSLVSTHLDELAAELATVLR